MKYMDFSVITRTWTLQIPCLNPLTLLLSLRDSKQQTLIFIQLLWQKYENLSVEVSLNLQSSMFIPSLATFPVNRKGQSLQKPLGRQTVHLGFSIGSAFLGIVESHLCVICKGKWVYLLKDIFIWKEEHLVSDARGRWLILLHSAVWMRSKEIYVSPGQCTSIRLLGFNQKMNVISFSNSCIDE